MDFFRKYSERRNQELATVSEKIRAHYISDVFLEARSRTDEKYGIYYNSVNMMVAHAALALDNIGYKAIAGANHTLETLSEIERDFKND